LLQTARQYFIDGGDRVRWTFPSVVISGIELAQRYKWREHYVSDYERELSQVFRFIHQAISILYNKVESSEICLRLYLLALQAADEAGLEELAYEFAAQRWVVNYMARV
jgi:vacuolar protein sorting-associated protein 35